MLHNAIVFILTPGTKPYPFPAQLLHTVLKNNGWEITASFVPAQKQRVGLVGRATLTAKQVAVLNCLAEGDSNEAIGRALDLSPSAVDGLLRRLFAKLGANNRTQAVAIAIREGLI
jgi:DNA-binding CsgD family transcriptional regulator